MNTILVVCDTWKRDHSGAYGNDRIHTPNINRFAEKSAVFENAYISSYPTLPCRRDIMTGRYEFPWRGWGGLEMEDVTLSGLLTEADKTSYFLTDVYHHWGKDAGTYWKDFGGFDLIRGQERDHYITDTDVDLEHPVLNSPPPKEPQNVHYHNAQYIRRDEEDWFCAKVFKSAARWVQHNADHDDFFLMIDAFDPHEPWDPPRHYTNMYDDPDYDGRELPVPGKGLIEGNLTPAELKHIQALYAGEISLVDRWFGHFLNQIEVMGLMDNTMIILTTDHGTFNGDRGRIGKNYILWDALSRIPLIIWHPEFGHNARLQQFAQPIDFFPTVLDAAGLPVPEGIHGVSLLPYLKNPEMQDPRDAIIFGQFGHCAYITNKEHWLQQGVYPSRAPLYSYSNIVPKWVKGKWPPFDGTRRLASAEKTGAQQVTDNSKGAAEQVERHKTLFYHIPSDPGQEHNIADSCPKELLHMRQLLKKKLEEIDIPSELLARFGLDEI